MMTTMSFLWFFFQTEQIIQGFNVHLFLPHHATYSQLLQVNMEWMNGEDVKLRTPQLMFLCLLN